MVIAVRACWVAVGVFRFLVDRGRQKYTTLLAEDPLQVQTRMPYFLVVVLGRFDVKQATLAVCYVSAERGVPMAGYEFKPLPMLAEH
jgi:hypothetical protein